MAEKKKLSTAEILAAARGGKAPPPPAAPAGAADDAPAAAAAPDDSSGEAAPAPAAKPAAKPAAAGAGGRPSVADILAMACAKKGEGEAPAAPKAAAPKPAAKPAADKPAAKPAAKAGAKAGDAKPAAPMTRDTASILAAARAGAKPGPVSKADAPALARPARPPAERAAAAEKPAAAKPALPALPPKPAKPAAAKKGAGKDGETESRRGFLEMAVGSFMAAGFTALSVTGGLFTLGLARFLFPNVLAEPPSRFKVGFKEAFPSGKVETKYVAQYGVWVVNSDVAGTQQIYALKTVCTHLGCTPNWLEAEQKFKCPCHGSGFYKDGVNFEGPAPRPLERYAIKVADDGQLEIDKSRTYHEELGQWADPESFIPV
ncbi:MAG: ubiquinol-cytochrome c reductase iron-sulfur subunit [Planctomycetaceae bacterium]